LALNEKSLRQHSLLSLRCDCVSLSLHRRQTPAIRPRQGRDHKLNWISFFRGLSYSPRTKYLKRLLQESSLERLRPTLVTPARKQASAVPRLPDQGSRADFRKARTVVGLRAINFKPHNGLESASQTRSRYVCRDFCYAWGNTIYAQDFCPDYIV